MTVGQLGSDELKLVVPDDDMPEVVPVLEEPEVDVEEVEPVPEEVELDVVPFVLLLEFEPPPFH